MKIKNKILASYFIIIFMVIISYSIYGYYKESTIIQDNMIGTIERSEIQVTSYLEYKLYYIDKIIDTFVGNEEINKILSRSYEGEDLNIRLKSQNEVSYELINLSKSAEIKELNLYCIKDYLIGHPSRSIKSFDDSFTEERRLELMEQNRRISWQIDPDLNYVTGTLWIMDMDNLQNRIALLEVIITTEEIVELIDISPVYKNSVGYIINSKGQILIATGTKEETISNEMYNLDKAYEMKFEDGIVMTDDNKYIVGRNSDLDNGWVLMTVVDYQKGMISYWSAYNELIIIIGASALVAYMVAMIMANKITGPIVKMSKEMRKVSKGNMNAKLDIKMDDEIGLLIDNYNKMVENLEQLVQERFNSGMEARKQEVTALEAQINPHLLYNTLDNINWHGINNDLPEISETVKDLANFYKLSLNNGNDTISVVDEVKFLKVYLRLMNLRYNGMFNVDFHMDEGLSDFRIIKLIHQPILENAIVHGILSSENEYGEIHVIVKNANEKIEFRIEDNGKGMTEEEKKRVMVKNSKGGYGLYNVKERLRIYYQENASISFESELDVGTSFTVRFPKERVKSSNS